MAPFLEKQPVRRDLVVMETNALHRRTSFYSASYPKRTTVSTCINALKEKNEKCMIDEAIGYDF